MAESRKRIPAAKPDLYEGSLDYVTPTLIEGWVYQLKALETPVGIAIFVDDQEIWSGPAGLYRKDLKDAGLGSGKHAFSFNYSADFKDKPAIIVSVRVKGTAIELAGSPRRLERPRLEAVQPPAAPPAPMAKAAEPAQAPAPAPPAPGAPTLNGAFDEVNETAIRGWAANMSAPNVPVSVDVFVDGQYRMRVTANDFRPDLLAGNIGTGFHAFSAPTPPNLLDGLPHSIGLRYSNTAREIDGSPRVFQHKGSAPDIYASELAFTLQQYNQKMAELGQSLTGLPQLQSARTEIRKASQYQEWWNQHRAVSEEDRRQIAKRLRKFPSKPKISILMPTYNTPASFLREAIDSVIAQLYPHWELCIADDASSDPEMLALLRQYAKEYEQIKVTFRPKNGHISEATNTALAMATGDYIAFFDHDDLLAEDALFVVADYVNRYKPDLLYSDEDKVDGKGIVYEPHFKPDFNYTLLLSYNYICHFTVMSKALVQKIGTLDSAYNGAQDHDYLLRACEQVKEDKIVHIPHVLYHWRVHGGSTAMGLEAKSYVKDAGVKAIKDHLARKKQEAKVAIDERGLYRVAWALPKKKPKISFIIPTRDCADILALCLATLTTKTDYENFEIIIVDNQSTEKKTFALFAEARKNKKIKIVSYDKPFNYSAITNFGVAQASGDLLCLLNNDIEVLDADWLNEMVGQALRPGVGAVGAKLLYPNDHVQHAGVILGLGGVAGHSHKKFHRSDPGYFHRLIVPQELSCCTAACLIVRREVYEEVKGLDEKNLPVSFNDVDLCLRIREKGYKVVYTPFATLRHHESYSRGPEDTPEKILRSQKEATYMRKRWEKTLDNDPAYSPNLTLDREDFSLDVHRGAPKPWLT